MPSPTSTTVPTLRVSTPASNWSIADFRMLVISSERMAMGTVLLQGARCELVPQPLEAAPDAPVDESIADPDDDPAEDRRVDVGFECDAAAGERFEAGRDLADLVVWQWRRARGGGVGQPVALVVEAGELGRDARQLLDPATPDEEQDEVADGLAQVGEHALRRVDPLFDGHRRVGEGAHQRDVRRGGGCGVELATPDLDGPVAEPDLEGGVRVAARSGVAASHQLVASAAPREPPEPDELPVSAR